jgi:DNA-binding transcriptional LysR family regulator
MDLRQLRYLDAVIRHRHFTRAADEMHVAQSAVSYQVRRLEHELGVELLRRTTRSVEPTETGVLVAVRARAVLDQVEALRSEVDEVSGLVRGRIGVGAMLFGGRLDIPALLASFTARYPQVEVVVREGIARRMGEMLADSTLDVAFALEGQRPDAVEALELSTEELVAVTSRDHPLAGAAGLPLARLAPHPLIAFEPGSSTRALVDSALARAGIQPRIAVEGNDLALVRALAASGLGVAILPRSFVERPGPRVGFRPLVPGLAMNVVLWWRRDRRLSVAARAFVAFVAERSPRAATQPGPRTPGARGRRPPGPARSAPGAAEPPRAQPRRRRKRPRPRTPR